MGHSNKLGPSAHGTPLSCSATASEASQGCPKVSDEEAAKWASLLVQSLTQKKAQHSLGLRPAKQAERGGQSHSTDPSQTALTSSESDCAAMTQSQLADTDGVNEAVPSRLILNVDSETLGRVQLVVDRDKGGVRVLVGSDPDARARLSEGKHAISEALSAAGVRVGALRFVTLNEVGTVLAQDLMSKTTRSESTKRDDTSGQDKSSTSKRHNLNLIG